MTLFGSKVGAWMHILDELGIALATRRLGQTLQKSLCLQKENLGGGMLDRMEDNLSKSEISLKTHMGRNSTVRVQKKRTGELNRTYLSFQVHKR